MIIIFTLGVDDTCKINSIRFQVATFNLVLKHFNAILSTFAFDAINRDILVPHCVCDTKLLIQYL